MQSDTDKRAAAIAALGGETFAAEKVRRVRQSNPGEYSQAICDLALHAIDSDGAAMLRELRDWVAAQLAQCRRQRYLPYWNGTIIAFQQVVAEIDRLLAAKPAPEPQIPDLDRDALLAWFACGDTGLSSKCIAAAVAGIRAPRVSEPYDMDDFGRCRRLVESVPGVRERLHMVAGLSPRWARIVERWDEIVEKGAAVLRACHDEPAPEPEPAPQPAAEPAATDEARIADWERDARSYEHDKAGLIYRVWSRDIHAAVDLMREFATRATQVVHRRQVTQTGEHFCETFCEERKRLLARAEKAEAEVWRWNHYESDAREAAEAAPDEGLIEAIKDLRKRAEKAEAEVERLTGLLDDATSTAATQADDIDDLRARLAAAEQQLAAAAKFPPGFVPEGCVREDDDALRDCLMTPLPDLVHGADSMRWLRIHSLGIKELCRRALAQEGTR